MDKNGVKVTIIETQFVTSDAASFKSVVQRLTGKSAGAAHPRPLHRPRPCAAGTGADGGSVSGPRSCYMPSSAGPVVSTEAVTANAGAAARAAPALAGAAPLCLEELHEMFDFSELFYAGASERRHGGGGSYNGFPY